MLFSSIQVSLLECLDVQSLSVSSQHRWPKSIWFLLPPSLHMKTRKAVWGCLRLFAFYRLIGSSAERWERERERDGNRKSDKGERKKTVTVIYKTDGEGHVGMFGSERDNERDERCSRTETETEKKRVQLRDKSLETETERGEEGWKRWVIKEEGERVLSIRCSEIKYHFKIFYWRDARCKRGVRWCV